MTQLLSPVPSILSHAEPAMHLLEGPPDIGKLAFSLHLALAYACGAAPWYGEAKFPLATVLVLSWRRTREYLNRVASTIVQESQSLRGNHDATWRERLRFGMDSGSFDRNRQDVVRGVIEQCQEAEAETPVRLIVLDDMLGAIPPNSDRGRRLERQYVNEYFTELSRYAQRNGLNILGLVHTDSSTRELGGILNSAPIVLRARRRNREGKERTCVYGREQTPVAYLRRSQVDLDVWNASVRVGSNSDAAVLAAWRSPEEMLSGREVARRVSGREEPGGRVRRKVNEVLRALCFGGMLEVHGSVRKPSFALRQEGGQARTGTPL